jgi:hypothetical protein
MCSLINIKQEKNEENKTKKEEEKENGRHERKEICYSKFDLFMSHFSPRVLISNCMHYFTLILAEILECKAFLADIRII